MLIKKENGGFAFKRLIKNVSSKILYSPHPPIVFRAKTPPAKRRKTGYGDDNDYPKIFYYLHRFYYL